MKLVVVSISPCPPCLRGGVFRTRNESTTETRRARSSGGQMGHEKNYPMLNRPPIPNAYVSLGSNLGDRAGNLLLGVRGMLDSGLDVIRLSVIYETDPVDADEQPAFLNMVAELRGNSLPSPEQVMARLLRVEYALGRTREILRGPRTLDLDLLLYREEIRDTEFLRLPHPRLHRRRFVLVPLAELVPRLVPPNQHHNVAELLSQLEDKYEVRRWRVT